MRSLLVALSGAALLVAGVVLLVTGAGSLPPAGGDFGWFAYTPLESGAGGSGVVVVTTGRLALVAVLGALGTAALAGAAGFRLGRRRRP